MSRHADVAQKLTSINPAVFQDLCDSFLLRRNKAYASFSRVGSQFGKEKTVAGTPDSLLLLPSGKYILVEYSTDVSRGYKKIKDDIRKCLDEKKTNIPLTQIDEIIVCTNFKLGKQVVELTHLLRGTYIQLSVFDGGALSIELFLNHRDLVHEFLGLPLDTGQIVSLQTFVKQYNHRGKGVATPLDNAFRHREKELAEVRSLLEANDIVVITGQAGVGKTRLAIECVRHFLDLNPSYEGYCIDYKEHDLLEDLYLYLRDEKDFIVIVDDANRVHAFKQLVGFYRNSRTGKLKFLITVRDYAFQEIRILLNDVSFVTLDVPKLGDKEIADIISAEPWNIVHDDLIQIQRIAQGNPRLAIMTASLAVQHQDLSALNDVSSVFERYFTSFVQDDRQIAEPSNLKILGVIAFFYSVPYKDEEACTNLLKQFRIGYGKFIEVIERLDRFEIIELQYEYVKISEQNLGIYFFFRAFISDELLSFDLLLENFFTQNMSRFRECVISAHNNFGSERVMNKVSPSLRKYYQKINESEESAFQFLMIFWYCLPVESLMFIDERVKTPTSNEEAPDFQSLPWDSDDYSDPQVIELGSQFFHYYDKYLPDVLNHLFRFCRFKPHYSPNLLTHLKKAFLFDPQDFNTRLRRQTLLFDILIAGVQQKDALLTEFFIRLSATFIQHEFETISSGNNSSITIRSVRLPFRPEIVKFRATLWQTIHDLYGLRSQEFFSVLNSYLSNREVDPQLASADVEWIVQIVDKNLDPNNFTDCRFVHGLVDWCNRNEVLNPELGRLKSVFTSEAYRIYLVIDWDRARDKREYEFRNYQEYEKLKESEIRNSIVLSTPEQIRTFIRTYSFIKKLSSNSWNYNQSLEFVVDEHLKSDFTLGLQLLNEIILLKNEIGFMPILVFINHLKDKDRSSEIWKLISSNEYLYRAQWEMSYFEFIDDSLIDGSFEVSILDCLAGASGHVTLNLFRLERFMKFSPNLFSKLLIASVVINNAGTAQVSFRLGSFFQYFESFGDLYMIEEAYLQQEKIEHHFDFERKTLALILERDGTFLLKYVADLYDRRSNEHERISNKEPYFRIVWEIADIESQLEKVFEFVIRREKYFLPYEHFCSSFFKDLTLEQRPRAIEFLRHYIRNYYTDTDRMNLAIDIINTSVPEMFSEAVLLFLSLTQSVEAFSKISWRQRVHAYSGNVFIGDIHAAEWRQILEIINKSPEASKLLQIKAYIMQNIDASLEHADRERRERFLSREY